MMKLILFCLTALLMFSSQISAKTRVMTFHYNKPEYIEWQYKLLKKLMIDDWELIVFNDGNTQEREEAIRAVCEKYGIVCIRYAQQWHETDPLNDRVFSWLHDPSISSHLCFASKEIKDIANQPSVRHCHVIQFALDHFGYNHDDLVVLLDGDCFPIRPMSLKELLSRHHLGGFQKLVDHIEYLWVPFIAFNPRTLPNKFDLKFHVDVVNNKLHDTGAHTYHFLKNNPKIRCRKFEGYNSSVFYTWSHRDLLSYGFRNREISLLRNLDSLKGFPWPITVEFHADQHFIHLANSSFELEGHRDKEKCVKDFFHQILTNVD